MADDDRGWGRDSATGWKLPSDRPGRFGRRVVGQPSRIEPLGLVDRTFPRRSGRNVPADQDVIRMNKTESSCVGPCSSNPALLTVATVIAMIVGRVSGLNPQLSSVLVAAGVGLVASETACFRSSSSAMPRRSKCFSGRLLERCYIWDWPPFLGPRRYSP